LTKRESTREKVMSAYPHRTVGVDGLTVFLREAV
jgi:hypothetical protein